MQGNEIAGRKLRVQCTQICTGTPHRLLGLQQQAPGLLAAAGHVRCSGRSEVAHRNECDFTVDPLVDVIWGPIHVQPPLRWFPVKIIMGHPNWLSDNRGCCIAAPSSGGAGRKEQNCQKPPWGILLKLCFHQRAILDQG